MATWIITTVLMLLKTVVAGPQYQSIKEETLAFEKLEIYKTFPTPCDKKMYLFTLGNGFNSSVHFGEKSKFECDWTYVVEPIPNSNLIFLALHNCTMDSKKTYKKSPTPERVIYNGTLPCFIATHNNFSRVIYMKCYNRSEEDDQLNSKDRYYCGHFWD